MTVMMTVMVTVRTFAVVAHGVGSCRSVALMTAAIYITSLAPGSGKSLVSLGAMEAAATRTARVGYFRPVISGADQPDAQIELMRRAARLSAPRLAWQLAVEARSSREMKIWAPETWPHA